jgi:cerevisin
MASPHTAGLLAYLLSIYPSTTFDPSIRSLIPPLELNTQRPFTGSFTRLYDSVYNVMPGWVSGFIPPPRLIKAITAPTEHKPLSPADLKSALIRLASKGLLGQIPNDTVNLLAFNNFTSDS